MLWCENENPANHDSYQKRGKAIGFDGYTYKKKLRYVKSRQHTASKKSAHDGNGKLRAK